MITIEDLEGNFHDVPARMSNGRVDAFLRADTLADMYTGLLAAGALTENEDGVLIPVHDIEVVYLPCHTITPATFDADGNELTPAVIDPRILVNLRLGPSVVERGLWKKTLILWANYGDPQINPNNSETGKKLNGIAALDPDTIGSPTGFL